MSITDFMSFFRDKSQSNRKIKDRISIKVLGNLKNLRDSCICTTQDTLTSIKQIIEESTDDEASGPESDHDKNTRLLFQELQFCRLLYYTTKNLNHLHNLKLK
jgi:hypothetical protein